MRNICVSLINSIDDELDLTALRKLIVIDLKNAELMQKKIGDNRHLDDMVDLLFDQLSVINKKIDSILKRKRK